MKRIRYFLFLFMSLFIFVPLVYAQDKVEIKSIELDSKSDTTTEVTAPSFNGLEMNLDLKFTKKDDFIKYKVILKNNTDETYKLSINSNEDNSYIEYKYDISDEIKANEDTSFYLTITYKVAVDDALIETNNYQQNNNFVLEIKDNEGNTVNPKTNDSIFIMYLILLLFISGLVYALKSKKFKEYNILLVLMLLIIPITVYAATSIELVINTKIQIEKKHTVAYYFDGDTFLTPEEYVNVVETEDTTCKEYKIQNVKYIKCKDFVFIDKKYTYGDKVDVYPITKKYLRGEILGPPDCSTIDEVYTCTEGLIEYNGSLDSAYGFNLHNTIELSNYNFTIEDNDPNIMFTPEDIGYDRWDEDPKGLGFYELSSFTMPGHDVIIAIDLPNIK